MPQDSNKPPTTYGQAAATYGDHAQKHTPDARELEARVLLKSAKAMQDLKLRLNDASVDEVEETLKYNRQIWMMFYDTALENNGADHTPELRSNILNLANFIFKREMDIRAKPAAEKFDVLININREIAAGLMGSSGSE